MPFAHRDGIDEADIVPRQRTESRGQSRVNVGFRPGGPILTAGLPYQAIDHFLLRGHIDVIDNDLHRIERSMLFNRNRQEKANRHFPVANVHRDRIDVLNPRPGSRMPLGVSSKQNTPVRRLRWHKVLQSLVSWTDNGVSLSAPVPHLQEDQGQ